MALNRKREWSHPNQRRTMPPCYNTRNTLKQGQRDYLEHVSVGKSQISSMMALYVILCNLSGRSCGYSIKIWTYLWCCRPQCAARRELMSMSKPESPAEPCPLARWSMLFTSAVFGVNVTTQLCKKILGSF